MTQPYISRPALLFFIFSAFGPAALSALAQKLKKLIEAELKLQ